MVGRYETRGGEEFLVVAGRLADEDASHLLTVEGELLAKADGWKVVSTDEFFAWGAAS